MKRILTFLTLSLCFILIIGCGSSRDAYQEEESQVNEDTRSNHYDSLADFLRKEGGLVVQGSGNNAKVMIRGTNTIKLETEPLFVIDGMPLGNSYAQANSAINANNIADVDVLRGASAMTLYGERSRNGVILIKTKLDTKLKEKDEREKKDNN